MARTASATAGLRTLACSSAAASGGSAQPAVARPLSTGSRLAFTIPKSWILQSAAQQCISTGARFSKDMAAGSLHVFPRAAS